VLLSALLALRLMGRRAAIIAALLTAAIPALVTRGAIVIVDTPAAFFSTAALLCAAYVRGARRGMLWALMGGAASGLATAAKYPTGIVIVSVVFLIAFAGDRSLRDRLLMIGASLAACAGAAVIAAPTLLFRTGKLLDEYRAQSEIYDTKVGTTYWHELLRGYEVGALLVVVALVGCLVLLRSTRTRAPMIAILLFGTALVVPLARYSFQPFRNVLPLLPLLAVAASVGIVAVVDAIGRLVHTRSWIRAGAAGAVGLSLCGVMIASSWQYYYDSRIEVTDSRIEARRWLAGRVGADDEVLVAGELAFLPSELAEIPGHVTVRSLTTTPDPAESANFEFVVVGDGPSAEKWRDTIVNRVVGAQYGSLVTSTDPRSYRFSDQVIRVFDGNAARNPDLPTFCAALADSREFLSRLSVGERRRPRPETVRLIRTRLLPLLHRTETSAPTAIAQTVDTYTQAIHMALYTRKNPLAQPTVSEAEHTINRFTLNNCE
jgi:hypothetical protein